MRTTHFAFPVLSLAAVAALVAGCTSSNDLAGESTAVDGGTLVYATGDAEPSCLDPHVGGNYPQALISTQYLEPLFGRSADGTIVPWLAQSAEASEDGLTWDITLTEGVSFSDGTAFNAEAVKVNIERLQDPDTASSTGYLAVEQVDEVVVIDDTHVRLLLSTPKSALPEVLSQQWTAMQSPTALARDVEANCQAPVGTGPFVVESWTPQEQVSLVRNDAYVSTNPAADHDGPAHLDRIEWRFIPDAATRQAALSSGEVNVIDNPLPSDIAAASAQGIGHIDAPRPASSNRIELNTAQTPFDDERVREAFARSADPDPGIDTLFAGVTTRSYSALSSVEPAAYSDEALFSVDIDRSNALLDEAGWTERDDDGTRMKDGQRLSVRFPVSTNQSTAAEQSLFEQIQSNTAGVGFDVQLTPMDLSSWYGALGEHAYEAVSAPYTTVGPDVLRILYHSDGTIPAPSGYFANHAMLRVDELDEALEAALATTDEDERTALYAEAQEIILGTYAIVPLYDQQNHFLTRGVTGVETLHTISTPTMINAQLTE
ncbi:ABC transporter substrate-binding protein [Microbacterium amylolyticum]|uniref:Peptide/nickel transport system substrate-binding protein n=1 Tax=Microbacterium amylolyticum TaxID=936337 RepID=A0ABS4ZDS8_9MICO|nr:ABC transporter substrate-binding protein [Microbacterium amylolyticum]MBP2435447.1 peptide/nickel transport system substrate-binding protein [Microbacterium amylolyticum]